MKKILSFIIPVVMAVFLVSCAEQQDMQRHPNRYPDDGYGRNYPDRRDRNYPNQYPRNGNYGSNWVELGSKRISNNGYRDVINVNSRYGNLRQLRFDVSGSYASIRSVVLTYRNNYRQEVPVRNSYNDRNSNSLVVNLPNRSDYIRQITYTYDNDRRNNYGNRAYITVYGR